MQYASLPTAIPSSIVKESPPTPVSKLAWHPHRSVVAFALAGDVGALQLVNLSPSYYQVGLSETKIKVVFSR